MPDDLPADAVPIRMLGPDDTGPGSVDPGTVDPGTVDPGTVDPDTVDHQILDPGAGGGGPSGRVVVALVAVLAVLVGVAGVLVYQRATTPGADSVDVGFMQDMTTHHQQAVEIASIVAETAQDPDIRAFAREILTFQSYEVGYMEALLEDWGQWPFSDDRTAMKWMDMASAPSEMPGMQTEASIQQLEDATGSQVDALFIPMMIDHHRGGVHMAEYAAEHASDPRVRDLATRIVTQQNGEIADFQRAAARLGVTL